MRNFVSVLALLFPLTLFAQFNKTDSSFLSTAKDNAIAVYANYMAVQSHLFNGSAYVEYQSQQEEHPYYFEEWIDGTVLYGGERYKAAFLYDLSIDKLITDNPYGYNKIQLITEKIEDFTLGTHRFVKLTEQSVPKGFYEITYDGQTKVYVRWQKQLQKRTDTGKVLNEFDERTTYYIKKDGTFYSVKSKGSILRVFTGKRQVLRKIMRDNQLRLKTDRITILNRMAENNDQSN